MKIKRKMKRTTKQYIMVALICITVIGGAAIFTSVVITRQIREEYQEKLKDAYYEMEINQREIYIAVEDISSGEAVTMDKLEKRMEYSSQPQETYITYEDIGKTALVNITAGTQLLNAMVTDNDISSEQREMEYDVIRVSSNIIDNDTVDIRIFYPNGEDFTVLAKKAIKGYTWDSTSCFLWLSEEEILRMQSAVVDAYLYTGAYLYTAKYIEPNLQEAAIVNYEPSVEAINLIRKNPNILETATNELSTLVRKALENRLANSMNKDVANRQWNLENDYIYQNNNSTNPMDETIDTNNVTDVNADISIISKTISDQTENPEVGISDENMDFNDTIGTDLGKNSGITGRNKLENDMKYFMLTEK